MTITKIISAMTGALIAVGLIAGVQSGERVYAQDAPILYQPNPDSPIGKRNAKAPAATGEFDFVIGDWDAVITWTPPGGQSQTYSAKWHNHWIVDGFVVMQEWRGPYLTGAEIRAYNPSLKQWVGQNIYVGGQWKRTTAIFEDGMMKVIIEAGEDKRGTFLNRETYYDIEKEAFKMKSDRSYDEGKTWEQGRYSMVVTRAHD